MKDKKAKIITLAMQKGGTGKTTTAITLYGILKELGYAVLFVDLDGQTSATILLNGDSDKAGSYELLTTPAAAVGLIQETADGCHIITASPQLLNIEAKAAQFNTLLKKLNDIRKYYDFIVIDTGPALNITQINALYAADYITACVQAQRQSLEGLKRLYGFINSINKQINANIKINSVLLTNHKARTATSQQNADIIRGLTMAYETRLHTTPIRQCSKVNEAQDIEVFLNEYAPKSTAALDYRAYVGEVLEDLKIKNKMISNDIK